MNRVHICTPIPSLYHYHRSKCFQGQFSLYADDTVMYSSEIDQLQSAFNTVRIYHRDLKPLHNVVVEYGTRV